MSQPVRRLLIVIPSLNGGGAERVVTRLLSGLQSPAFKIEMHLALFYDDIEYAIPEGVHLHRLLGATRAHCPGAIRRNVRIALALRRAMRAIRPDVALSFMEHANLHLATTRVTGAWGARLVLSEHAPFRARFQGGRRHLFALLYRVFYALADRIICVADGIVDELVSMGVSRGRCVTIHNAVDAAELLPKAQQALPNLLAARQAGEALFVAAGRLGKEKGHDILIEALAQLVRQGRQARVVILGKGELDAALRRQVDELGLRDRVVFAGFDSNPFPYFAQATAFVFPSRYEGFGIALLEAMVLGVPVVAADCDFGPRDILGDSEYGQLVPAEDATALAEAMDRLIGDDTLSARYRALALEGAARFTPERILQQYRAVLLE